jgi:hypothetical protein
MYDDLAYGVASDEVDTGQRRRFGFWREKR